MELADKIEQIRQKNPQDQTVIGIKRKNWMKYCNPNNELLFGEIFGENDFINLSRNRIFNEQSPQKKALETIIWGYPTGWPKKTMLSIVDNLSYVVDSLSSDCKANYFALLNIKGLGWSTLTKLLYFFNCSIDDNQCLILDRIVRSASLRFADFSQINMKNQGIKTYCSYIRILNKIANKLIVSPDQIELFLFEEGKK